jgi:hypothetical protein
MLLTRGAVAALRTPAQYTKVQTPISQPRTTSQAVSRTGLGGFHSPGRQQSRSAHADRPSRPSRQSALQPAAHPRPSRSRLSVRTERQVVWARALRPTDPQPTTYNSHRPAPPPTAPPRSSASRSPPDVGARAHVPSNSISSPTAAARCESAFLEMVSEDLYVRARFIQSL